MPQVIPSRVDNHIERRLSALRGQFLDQEAYAQMLSTEDQLIYEVYEIQRPEVEGELLMGVSIVHPGKVGKEFFMTKGHFHTILATSEIYYCMRGEGYMVMETPEGDTSVPNYAFAGLNAAATLENTIDNADSPLRLIDFKPAIKLRDVINVIFSGSYSSGSTGYQYTSSFFESTYFNNLYLLTTSTDALGPNTVNPITQNIWVYRSGSTSQTIPYNIATEIDYNAISYNTSNNFNLTTNAYTADAQGTYNITAQIKFNVNRTIK